MERVKTNIKTQVNIKAGKLCKKAERTFQREAERMCAEELPCLMKFLASNTEPCIRTHAIHVARKKTLQRSLEWAQVQINPALFRRVIIRESEKCAGGNPRQPKSLYPNDFSRKLPEPVNPGLDVGFVKVEQLSDLIDREMVSLDLRFKLVNASRRVSLHQI